MRALVAARAARALASEEARAVPRRAARPLTGAPAGRGIAGRTGRARAGPGLPAALGRYYGSVFSYDVSWSES
ncbi:hypothetical protein [Streptomyces sp. NPDC048385]|uniref:hypothetical protein n=1 Tax=unclassified Streptomyces TaxID=2593676 RepID=UPI00344012FE